MIGFIDKILKTGVVTSGYPHRADTPAPAFRGRPESDPALCQRCGDCGQACVTGALEVEPAWLVDLGRCIFCGRCEKACPSGALKMTRDFELAAPSRPGLLRDIAGDPANVGRAGELLRKEIRSVLGRSLHIRHLDSGSCNGCDFEMTALLNPVHDIQRFGIDFVASPRHADLLLVTGPVTRNLEVAVRKTYEATPEPRVVVAMGSCACSGGIFADTYAVAGGVDKVLPVDLYIPGCPPRPQAVIHGLLAALGRLPRF